MDFESPDVEKDFPGLFASETTKKCNESDFSDESHDKSYKKDLITGKKKEKRDSKKDRGYAALEGESSAEETADSKSPSKSKKSKSFKFSTKKSEKREKSREKDAKEKEPEKEKKRDKEKKEKDKVKQKDRKKSRNCEDLAEYNGDYPVFGVDLATSVERSHCLDGIPIPLVVRNCIDCIHESGLSSENLYKTVCMKSKLLAIKKAYNFREPVSLKDYDVSISTCLLKTFLRELPEPILTNDLLARFEEAGAIMEVESREIELQNLIEQLPHYNKILLSWLIVHFDTITLHEKRNKLNAQSIAMTFSPVLQMSHRLLTAFLCHCKALFPDTVIEKYIPPLCAGSSFPENSEEIANELKKQESLLNQIHTEMSQGFVSKKREEQLWEVQRIVTQLKRCLRSLHRSQETNAIQRSIDEDQALYEDNSVLDETRKHVQDKNFERNIEDSKEFSPDSKSKHSDTEKISNNHDEDRLSVNSLDQDFQKEGLNLEVKNIKISQIPLSPKSSNVSSEYKKNSWSLGVMRSQVERDYLYKLQNALEERIESERQLVEWLNSEINNFRVEKDILYEKKNDTSQKYSSETETTISKLVEENNVLAEKKDELVRKIFQEKLACLQLKVDINLLDLKGRVPATL